MLWSYYFSEISKLEIDAFKLPIVPEFATNNGHMFYLTCLDGSVREKLIQSLKEEGFHAVFHYLSLHSSEFYKDKHDKRELLNSDHYTDCLVRLPLYFELEQNDLDAIVKCIKNNFK
jgi:dTDP-4-amino-4,6-dideoxygalactose transaminase